MLIRFVLELLNSLDGLIFDYRASCSKLLLPLLERQTPLRRHRLGSRLSRRRLDLLLASATNRATCRANCSDASVVLAGEGNCLRLSVSSDSGTSASSKCGRASDLSG